MGIINVLLVRAKDFSIPIKTVTDRTNHTRTILVTVDQHLESNIEIMDPGAHQVLILTVGMVRLHQTEQVKTKLNSQIVPTTIPRIAFQLALGHVNLSNL